MNMRNLRQIVLYRKQIKLDSVIKLMKCTVRTPTGLTVEPGLQPPSNLPRVSAI